MAQEKRVRNYKGDKKHIARTAKYNETHTTQVALRLNLVTDADVLEQLDRVDSKRGYILKLIREDIARQNKAE